MKLEETLEQDLQQAMRSKDADKLGVLRMVKAALINYKIEKKKENLTDEDLVEIIQKQAKQRRESIEGFTTGGRPELAKKEERELQSLQAYLPKQMSAEEIKAAAQKIIQSTGAKTAAESGKVMKELMPFIKGKADGKLVNQIVQDLLK